MPVKIIVKPQVKKVKPQVKKVKPQVKNATTTKKYNIKSNKKVNSRHSKISASGWGVNTGVGSMARGVSTGVGSMARGVSTMYNNMAAASEEKHRKCEEMRRVPQMRKYLIEEGC